MEQTRSRLFTDAKNFKHTRSSSSNANNMRLDRSDSGSQLCIAAKKNSYLTATKYFTCNLSKFKYAIKISWNIFIQRVVFLYKEVFYIARCKVTFLLAQTDYFLREKSTKYLVILAIKISMRLLILISREYLLAFFRSID